MKSFTETILTTAGDRGKAWLELLPTLVEQACSNWGLRDVQPVKNLSYNYVLTGFRENQEPIVLKFILDKQAFEHERDALMVYNGHGCVRLLASDHEKQCLLLEQIRPGVSLKTIFLGDNFDRESFNKDEQAALCAVNVMKKLHAVDLSGHDLAKFQMIQDWLAGLTDPACRHQIPEKYLIKAKGLANELLKTQEKSVLLHGDLHHENILSHNNDWCAIDPKGVMGEPAYEVGAFIRNPISMLYLHPNLSKLIDKRIELFSECLMLDRQRVQAWSFVQAVLAACWMVHDNQNPEHLLGIIGVLNKTL